MQIRLDLKKNKLAFITKTSIFITSKLIINTNGTFIYVKVVTNNIHHTPFLVLALWQNEKKKRIATGCEIEGSSSRTIFLFLGVALDWHLLRLTTPKRVTAIH